MLCSCSEGKYSYSAVVDQHCGVHGLSAKLKRAEAKVEAADLIVLYVNDLVDMWPSVTFRTIGRVTEKVSVLKDAVKAYMNAGNWK